MVVEQRRAITDDNMRDPQAAAETTITTRGLDEITIGREVNGARAKTIDTAIQATIPAAVQDAAGRKVRRIQPEGIQTRLRISKGSQHGSHRKKTETHAPIRRATSKHPPVTDKVEVEDAVQSKQVEGAAEEEVEGAVEGAVEVDRLDRRVDRGDRE